MLNRGPLWTGGQLRLGAEVVEFPPKVGTSLEPLAQPTKSKNCREWVSEFEALIKDHHKTYMLSGSWGENDEGEQMRLLLQLTKALRLPLSMLST